MTAHDLKTGRDMLKEDFVRSNPEWVWWGGPGVAVVASGVGACVG